MANETTPVFNAEQAPVIDRLSGALAILGPLLLTLGALRLGWAAVEVWKTSIWTGLLILPEGLLLVFAGLAFWAGSTDAKLLHGIKGREKEHFTHTLQSVNAGFTALLILGCYVAFIAFISLWL